MTILFQVRNNAMNTVLVADPGFVFKKMGGGGLRLLGLGGLKKLLLAALPILDIIKYVTPQKLIWYFFYSFTLLFFYHKREECIWHVIFNEFAHKLSILFSLVLSSQKFLSFHSDDLTNIINWNISFLSW